MCIAILNNENNVIDFATLQTCWDNNRDGAGMLYIKDGKLKVHKEMASFNKFYDAYLRARKNDMDKKIVLHFRISTHGKVNKTNCHPFLVNDDLGFVHNGIISGLEHSKEYSDTYMFNRNVLQKLPNGFLSFEGILAMMEDFIDYSKLIFLDAENNATIINEVKGVWDGGNWFSNYTYKDYGYYDVGGVKIAKKDSVFQNGIMKKDTYGTSFLPKNDATFGTGVSYAKGITKTYSDNDDWDNPRFINLFEDDETCECCRNLSDTLKFSQNYRIYCCKSCWNEYVAEQEGVWNGQLNVDEIGI